MSIGTCKHGVVLPVSRKIRSTKFLKVRIVPITTMGVVCTFPTLPRTRNEITRRRIDVYGRFL